MSNTPRSPTPDKSLLLLDFPVRLYTALRTMRLYPATNPQVQRSNYFVFKAFNALASKTENSVSLAISDLKILVCGEHLADRDQERPQIQGLITLLNRLKIHSFSFHPSFDYTQCEIFIQSLANLIGDKELSEPLADLLTRAGLHSVSVDAKNSVAGQKGEQVVRDELIGTGLNISDEELAQFVLGKLGSSEHPRAIDTELIEELINAPAHAGLTLAGIAEKLADAGQWQRLEKLLPALDQTIRFPGMDETGVAQSLTAIRRLADHYLGEEHFDRAGATIQFLRNLSTDEQPGSSHNPQVRNQALSTLNNLSTKPVLERLLDRYLHSEPLREAAGQILTELGVESAKFQLQQLMSNESRFERKQLLTLIKQPGNPAVSILLEQLNKKSPWFVVRNIIRLLGEIGKPELLQVVRPFITHVDLRVQQEVISTAVKIGGEHLKDFLFQALQSVDDSLQVKVVAHVATAQDERFVRPLTDLLESTKPFLGKDKNYLHMAICKTLGAIGSKRATASLHRVVEDKTALGLGGYSDEVRQAAGLALEQIRDKAAVKIPAAGMEYESDGTDDHPHGTGTAIPDHRAREENIFALVAQGNRDQAKKDLLDLIGVTARAGDFQTAERLRERIYEIDSLALGEIIRSGEIIEEEKRGAIKEEDLEIWAGLTDCLTTEEFQNIYHEFSEQRFKPEEVLVSQGDRNDALFFINQGSIKVSHMLGTRELFITSLNRGQIAGENFFTPSFWTVSLTSLTPSRVYILRQETLNAWQERFPGLRAKLHDFYRACNNIRSMLEKKGLERRRDQRFNLSRKIQVQPINNLDTPVGRGFRAETTDISQGGLGFLIRISRQENARLLLGRRLQVVLPVGGKTKYLYLKGLVIGVQPFQVMENDFSVHFKFDQPMDPQGLQMVLG